ncbi:dermonecrotic toxin domain-containing protein [Pseudomonas taiwanensis]|uniref:dermonecrotic toxin domain-containing protein n=1 Tax=Pseudomonas taiwanensis TaxID=470150 RepID=UPI0003F9F4E9|nr:DUF6543 domain-containing protein [Pseudomonas taiwanensis]
MTTFSDLPLDNHQHLHPHDLILAKLPTWMLSAAPHTFEQMRAAIKDAPHGFLQACASKPTVARRLARDYEVYRTAQAQARSHFESLPDLEQFARQQLTAAMKTRFDLDLDVTQTFLFNASKAQAYQAPVNGDPLIGAQRAFRLATQSLLHCALQNFEAAEALPGGLDGETLVSSVLDSNAFQGLQPTGNPVRLAPHAFAARVRELDIGGQYQALIQDASTALAAAEQSAFRLEIHRAYLGELIDQTLHEALLAFVDHGQGDYQGGYLRCAFLNLFEIPLTGALVIGVVPSPEQLLWYDATTLPYQDVLLTYLPGAPIPLKAHAGVHQAQAHLREQLWAMEVRHLQQAVAARDSATFITRLRDCLQPIDWTTYTPKPGHQGGQAQRVRDPDAWVPVTLQPITRPLADELARQKQLRFKDDALFHAVPTAFEDQKSAQKRRAYFEQLAFTALNIGAFVVPGLGALMLGLSAIQLSYEVYEGVESWADGDRDQAFDYLLDVVENVALLGVLGATGGANGTPAIERISVETPSFIEALEPVTLPDGDTRLWQPDLKPFAHDIVLPAGLEPDEAGLYHHDGKTWLPIDGETYRVEQSPPQNEYRLVHPVRPLSYEPPLRHNGAGAWLHPLDRPEQWQELALFRRASHLSTRFDDRTAVRLLRVSGTDEDVLRRTVIEQHRLPGPLQDSMTRFELYQSITQQPALTEPGHIHAAFQAQYLEQPVSVFPGADTVRSRYPNLPKPVIEELLQNVVPDELAELRTGRIPRRLAEEARLLQQQVRLNRAYEGLYLENVRNWDTDLLVLHTLEGLPGWSPDIAITLEQRLHSPTQADSIGPHDASGRKTIICTHTGYVVVDSDSLDQPIFAHGSLYGALFEVLAPTQRQALGVTHGQALKRLVQQGTPLTRAALRKVLGMQPVRPGFRSPMRLADGRIGYPLGGTRPRITSISRQTLLNAIRQIGLHAPVPRPAEQTLAALESRGMTRTSINDLLQNLMGQRNQLHSSLGQWRRLAERMPHQPADHLERLLSTISQYWYDSAFAPASQPLRLERLSLLEFPLNLPEFFTEGVTDLQLVDTSPEAFEGWTRHAPQLNNLLRQFSNLRTLDISRAYRPDAPPSPFQFSLPLIAQHVHSLESLSLTHQNLSLSATDIDSLMTLTSLRRLDLSGNRLSEEYPPSFDELTLDYLGLDNMNLDHWPRGLGYNAVSHIRHISLRNNQIRVLPNLLLSNRVSVAEHAQLSLQGNQIFEDEMQRVLLSEDGRAARFEMDQTADFRAHLALLLERRQQLRDLIDNYVNASSSTAILSQAVMASRMRIATALSDFWHNQEIGLTRSPLRLEGISLEHFPRRLPAFFTDQVRSLTLERVRGTSNQLSELLGRFAQVTRLTVDSYLQAQQTLPSALLRLPNLTELALRNSGLEIDQAVLDTLGRLHSLDTLDLSGNRMGQITTTPPALRSLRRLDLNEMGLRHWPSWVDSLLPLEMLDLSDNRLTELPANVLANLDSDLPISSILLLNNPLTDETVYRARLSSDSQRSFTFAMDAPDSSDDGDWFGHFHSPVLDTLSDEPRLDDWLLASEVENQAMSDCWQQLEASGAANDLLMLVGRLKNTASYQNGSTRLAFCERVRKVLVQALLNPDDLVLFNLQAREALPQENGSQTCHDGALLAFKNIEFYMANQRLQIDGVDSEANLYREVRRLYRLHTLDEVAKRETGDRDEAEVRLTYLRELNVPLELGQPVDSLRYAINASIEELTDAELQVQRGELGEDFLHFAEGNERWVQHLRLTHAERFADIENTYRAQVTELSEQHADSPLSTLTEALEALDRSKKARESRLIRELTAFANPDRRPRSTSA